MSQEAGTIIHHGGAVSPDNFLVLIWRVSHEGERTLEREAGVASSLEEARSKLSSGRKCISRQDTDHPSLIESWVSVYSPESSTRFRIARSLGASVEAYTTELYFVQPDGRCISDGAPRPYDTIEEARKAVHAGGLPMKLVPPLELIAPPGERWRLGRSML